MNELFTVGFLAGLALAIPVGPMAILLVNTTIERGIRHGIVGALAMASIDFSYAFSVFSLGQIIAQFVGDFGIWLSLGGALILIALGLQTLSRNLRLLGKPDATPIVGDAKTGLIGTYAKFAGATVLNPPTALYFLAIAPSLGVSASVETSNLVASHLFLAALIFAIGVFVGSVLWQEGLALAGLGLRQITSNRVRPWIGSIGGILIIGLAIKISLEAIF